MLSLVHSSTRVRPVNLPVQPFVPIAPTQEICVGVPSCSPLLQFELLKAMREQLPQAYLRAGSELGVTVSRTQDLIERRVEIISAARVIKLARMIAYEPNAHEVFGEAGAGVLTQLKSRASRICLSSLRQLPRGVRVPLALAWAERISHHFAGSVNQMFTERQPKGMTLSIRHGVFADRLDTLGCAQAYYRRVFESIFQDLVHVECEVREVRRPRVYLDQCRYEIVWEA